MRGVVIIAILSFGGALILHALVLFALRHVRLRQRAADPYAKPFGDYPRLTHQSSRR